MDVIGEKSGNKNREGKINKRKDMENRKAKEGLQSLRETAKDKRVKNKEINREGTEKLKKRDQRGRERG